VVKTVLCATPGGACKLIEVPFDWRPGDAVPPGSEELHFDSVAEALSELAARGRNAARVHIPKPERPPPASGSDTPNER
jgi:hypothetical protein